MIVYSIFDLIYTEPNISFRKALELKYDMHVVEGIGIPPVIDMD